MPIPKMELTNEEENERARATLTADRVEVRRRLSKTDRLVKRSHGAGIGVEVKYSSLSSMADLTPPFGRKQRVPRGSGCTQSALEGNFGALCSSGKARLESALAAVLSTALANIHHTVEKRENRARLSCFRRLSREKQN